MNIWPCKEKKKKEKKNQRRGKIPPTVRWLLQVTLAWRVSCRAEGSAFLQTCAATASPTAPTDGMNGAAPGARGRRALTISATDTRGAVGGVATAGRATMRAWLQETTLMDSRVKITTKQVTQLIKKCFHFIVFFCFFFFLLLRPFLRPLGRGFQWFRVHLVKEVGESVSAWLIFRTKG